MKNKIRNVLVFNDYAYLYGGAGKVAFDGAIALADIGYKVTFIAGTGSIDVSLLKHEIKCICLNQPDLLSDKNRFKAACRGVWNHKAYKVTKKLLKQYNPNNTVILVHGYSKTLSVSIFAAMKNSGFKVIYTLHDYFAACPNGGFYDFHHQNLCSLKPLSFKCICRNCDSRSYFQKLYRVVRQFVIRCCLKDSNNFYAYNVSEMSKQIMEPYIANYFKVYDVLTNPVDVNVNEKFSIINNHTYLFIGRLSVEKGIEDFCKVITELGLQGVVLGDGYLMEKLKKAYPNIVFKGWVDGKTKVQELSCAKCVIFSSKVHETYGLVIPESLSYGVPCIVPDGCGATNLIVEGRNGFIFKMGDYNDLKSKVLLMENAKISEISNYITETFRSELFSMNSYIMKLVSLFE